MEKHRGNNLNLFEETIMIVPLLFCKFIQLAKLHDLHLNHVIVYHFAIKVFISTELN